MEEYCSNVVSSSLFVFSFPYSIYGAAFGMGFTNSPVYFCCTRFLTEEYTDQFFFLTSVPGCHVFEKKKLILKRS